MARLIPAALLLVLCGCRDEQAGPKPRPPPLPPATAQARVLAEAPPELTFRSGATWANGAVRYLGSKVTPAQAQPGQPYTVSHYFRAEGPQPAGYQFFVHLVDPDSGQMLFNADHEIQGGQLPLGRWPEGKVVEDVHQVFLPGGLQRARLLLGFWAGDSRLPVDDRKAEDGLSRMLGPTLGAAAALPELPEYRAVRFARPPKIDGVLDDAVWARATPVNLVGSFDGRRPSLGTTARIGYDDANLYVAFDCQDPDAWGTYAKRDDPIYTQEAVEIFLDANADLRTYNELEVSPHNVLFDAYFPARRQGMDLSWDSGTVSAVKIRGTLDDDSDEDEGWSVEMQIPFAKLAEVPHRPPQKDERWRFNLYRLEVHQRKQVEGMAFSPLFLGDFHNLPRFGWLIFE